MYAYIDRPVRSLDPASRFLLRAMRGWADSIARRRCPPAALGPAFGKMGALDALPHFHILMISLNREGLQKVELGAMDSPVVGEHEAVLLSLWHLAAADQSLQAKTILTLIVREEAVSTAAMALRQAVAHLAHAALLPRLTN